MRGYHLLPDMDWVMEGRYVFSFSEFMFLPLLIVFITTSFVSAFLLPNLFSLC